MSDPIRQLSYIKTDIRLILGYMKITTAHMQAASPHHHMKHQEFYPMFLWSTLRLDGDAHVAAVKA